MTNLNIGHRLQKLRITRSGSLKQKDVAEAIEISAPLLCAYENDTRIPSLNNIIKLANFYRTSLDYICGINKSYTLDLSNLDESEIKKVLDFIDLIEQEKKLKNSLTYKNK